VIDAENIASAGPDDGTFAPAQRGSTPFSPPSGPAQTLFQWLPAKSKFLAASKSVVLHRAADSKAISSCRAYSSP
jgi:hypothetical protein